MKKTITLFMSVALLAMTTVSCDKDETTTKNSIEGKWICDDTYVETLDGGQTNDTKSTYPSGCDKKASLELASSGDFVQVQVGPSSCGSQTFNGKWSYANNILHTVDDTDYVIDFPVISVSANKLVIKQYMSMFKNQDGSQNTDTYYVFTYHK